MKKKLLNLLSIIFLFLIPASIFAQAPNLGSTVDFALFTSDGSVTNTGISHLTGHVGTNNGSSTGFGNVNGVMHDNDAASAQAATDLLVAYNQLNNTTPNSFPAASLGNGQTLTAGVHAISGAATISLDLILDAQNNSNAVFIIQIAGPLSTNANSKVKLINGAQACNVFWKVEGLVDMATGTTMRGTVIANNAGINMNTGDTLEGRVLSTTGAISIDGVLVNTPIGCGSPTLTGPTAPILGEVACYGIFSSDGSATNSGTTNVIGDVGANVGLTTGFDTLLVTGNVHPDPDGSTQQAANDLLLAYNYLNGLTHDIELLYPAQFGENLVLTPHTYLLNAATTFSGKLYLNAQGNTNAVFVIQIEGALATSTYSKVKLTNGTQAKNVYWLVNGAVDINDYSVFNGTIISQGAISLLTGVNINGKALAAVGTMETYANNSSANIPSDCETVVGGETSIAEANKSQSIVMVYPNPFRNSITIKINNASKINTSVLRVHNVLGVEVMSEIISSHSTTFDTSNLPKGMYFYKVIGNDNAIQSGTMVSQR